jgi:RNA polymerase sigma-70 factor (sigma-E family)
MQFEQYVHGRGAQLLGFAVVLCGDRELAQDVLQEVFLKAQPRWPQIDEMEFSEAYLRRMIVNEFLSWRRKWGRVRLQAEVESRGHVADHAGAHAERDALIKEIVKLPPRQRAVVALRYYAGLSDREIADVLGCKPASVRAYSSRALRTLRVELLGNLVEKEAT